MERILVTGALGQIGTELVEKLRTEFGADNVIATDIKHYNETNGIYETFDVLDKNRLFQLVEKYHITTIYHLAALLSGTAEKNPRFGWELNTVPLLNILEIAREEKIKMFFPSSIAVFGKDAEKNMTPQVEKLHPNSVYGISKTAGELWCNYYFDKYGVDVRSIRFPGLISWKTKAGGGTTDYAVDIFYEALEKEFYECFIAENTYLPMLYMDDAINATLDLMQAPKEKITIRTSYNLGGLSFSPKELYEEIKKYIPNFTITYNPDFRQTFADSWPNSVDDKEARNDWNFSPKYNLEAMTKIMLKNLERKLNIENAF